MGLRARWGRGRGTRANDPSFLPRERLGREARLARNLERVYDVGQDRIWNGGDVLQTLLDKHGPVDIPEPACSAVRELLGAMLWGELAAWKVSAELAPLLPSHEGRLAATSQAHDEARHFRVIHDYLELIGGPTDAPAPSAMQTLDKVLAADTLAKKLVGMQLLVEPVALTLFTILRRSEVCPVLTELLPYLEQDEARHVNVGTNLLPELVRDMGWAEAADYWAYQGRLFHLEVRGLAEMEPALRTLGFDPREVYRLGQGKQVGAARMVTDQLGGRAERITDWMRAGMEFTAVYRFPGPEERRDVLSRLRAGLAAARQTEAPAAHLLVR